MSQPKLENLKIKKMIFQEEIGESGTLHLQGFVQFENQVDFNKLKKILPTAHLEKTKSVAASIKYCSKKNTRSGALYTYGISDSELSKEKKPPLEQEEILDNLKELALEDPKWNEEMATYFTIPMTVEVDNYWVKYWEKEYKKKEIQ